MRARKTIKNEMIACELYWWDAVKDEDHSFFILKEGAETLKNDITSILDELSTKAPQGTKAVKPRRWTWKEDIMINQVK